MKYKRPAPEAVIACLRAIEEMVDAEWSSAAPPQVRDHANASIRDAELDRAWHLAAGQVLAAIFELVKQEEARLIPPKGKQA